MTSLLIFAAIGSLSVASPPQYPFECHFEGLLTEPEPISLPVARYVEERRGSYRNWTFEPAGVVVFGRPAIALNHSISSDEQSGDLEYYYSAVIESSRFDDIRYEFEQLHSAYRCRLFASGTEFVCISSVAGEPTFNVAVANRHNNPDGLTNGVAVTCRLFLQPRM